MKMWTKSLGILMGIMLLALIVTDVQAQGQQGPGRARFTETPKILSDALLLDAAKSEEIVKIYTESRDASTSGQQQPDWQSMSQEERMAQMTKIQKEVAAAFKQKVAGKLSEQQLKDIDPLLSQRFFRPIAELRALRSLTLKEDQVKSLQPAALELVKSMIRQEGENREDVQKRVDEQKAKFVEKANAALSAEQKTAWNTKIEEVKKALEEQMQQMRQGGQGGGQGR